MKPLKVLANFAGTFYWVQGFLTGAVAGCAAGCVIGFSAGIGAAGLERLLHEDDEEGSVSEEGEDKLGEDRAQKLSEQLGASVSVPDAASIGS